MKLRCLVLLAGLAGWWAQGGIVAEGPPARNAKEALQPFNDLIGSWRGTATPNGTKEEKQKNFWVETITWEWQFKDKDAWLAVTFDKSKHFTKGTLRYLAASDQFELALDTVDKEQRKFVGQLKEKVLILEGTADDKNEVQRVVITLLHDNRYLYRVDKKKADKTIFTNLFSVGATKEGQSFADAGAGKPECVVSGGLGTMPVTYNGKTYYVCCSGCRSEFNADPAKYVREFEERKAKKDKK
jgi:ribosomal protein L24E